jgi:hypothetical protein
MSALRRPGRLHESGTTARVSTQSDQVTVSPGRQRWAWVVPVAVLVTFGALGPLLDDFDLPEAAVASVEFYVGVLAGALWQLVYPRDLFARFRVWAGLIVVAALLGFLPVAQLDRASIWAPPWAPLGVVVGVVVCDAWMRRRRDRL